MTQHLWERIKIISNCDTRTHTTNTLNQKNPSHEKLTPKRKFHTLFSILGTILSNPGVQYLLICRLSINYCTENQKKIQ